jgi:hypothetical protein
VLKLRVSRTRRNAEQGETECEIEREREREREGKQLIRSGCFDVFEVEFEIKIKELIG